MDFLELCKKRFSTRKFSAQKIDEQTLEHIMECVRMAPSAVNRQPWKFIVVGSESAKEKLVQCYDRQWFRSAPLYVICMKDTTNNWVRAFDDKPHGDIDLAIAIEHLCLSAAECELGLVGFVILILNGSMRFSANPDMKPWPLFRWDMRHKIVSEKKNREKP